MDANSKVLPSRWGLVAVSRWRWIVWRWLLALGCGWGALTPAQAGVGLTEIAATAEVGVVTLYYPSSTSETPITRGRFGLALRVAEHGVPVLGNGRLVLISHGSGSNPWVHADLARRLVMAGFVVALPEHRGDNYQDDAHPGPESWAQRPAEASRAIDAVGRDPRFASLLNLDKVGVYGFSAGGHTVLSLAGGRWSPAHYRHHCLTHLEADFQSCVGLTTQLTGGFWDGFKKWLARTVISHRYADATWQTHSDPRIAAAVAAAPTSADFDMASFATLRVPLGLVTLGQDRWLVPRFHSERVLAACPSCEHIAHLPNAHHGAMLSPLPPGFTGLLGELVNDPPGFDRSVLPDVDQKITAFFEWHLR